jgi:hypothetical protein
LWLDPPVSIDTALIAWITGLPKSREDPTTFFNKARERALSKQMKEKFHTFRGKRGLDVMNINDDSVQFVMQVLACKLLHKFRKDEVLIAVIATIEKCFEGVQMN